MNYIFGFIVVFLVLGAVVLSGVSVPYQGVVVLMGVSFFCCVFMAVIGRTFAALMVYIVYLGGLVVVFGYCVSVEKDNVDVFKVGVVKYFVIFVVLAVLWGLLEVMVGGFLVYSDWGGLVCMEVNGGSVLYFKGGVGLIVCSWGLLVVLFSILVILSWSRLGGLRPF
uniref:NADH dehydrogenase subunit 6 n=1 Tax=Oligodon chinensis TaxID=928511 RepID=A0A7G9UAP0_9SAUR|nr:NADH dehydrogenase subunit 6 [Oligodon chinensis]QNN90171.1 NADH dehydrogenase subunit 6 [Oligodon chinensis]